MFLDQISILELFLKDHTEDQVIAAEKFNFAITE